MNSAEVARQISRPRTPYRTPQAFSSRNRRFPVGNSESSPVWRGRLGGSGAGGEGAVGVDFQVVDQDPAAGAVAARAGIVAGAPRPGAAEPPRSQPHPVGAAVCLSPQATDQQL